MRRKRTIRPRSGDTARSIYTKAYFLSDPVVACGLTISARQGRTTQIRFCNPRRLVVLPSKIVSCCLDVCLLHWPRRRGRHNWSRRPCSVTDASGPQAIASARWTSVPALTQARQAPVLGQLANAVSAPCLFVYGSQTKVSMATALGQDPACCRSMMCGRRQCHGCLDTVRSISLQHVVLGARVLKFMLTVLPSGLRLVPLSR